MVAGLFRCFLASLPFYDCTNEHVSVCLLLSVRTTIANRVLLCEKRSLAQSNPSVHWIASSYTPIS